MPDRQHGMVHHHSGPGIPHDHPRLLTHSRLVAVDRALIADRFLNSERTSVYALFRIGEQFLTLPAQPAAYAVPGAAVHMDHRCYRPFF
jgi:hypothetical protein